MSGPSCQYVNISSFQFLQFFFIKTIFDVYESFFCNLIYKYFYFMPGKLVQDEKENSEGSKPFAQNETVCCEVQASSSCRAVTVKLSRRRPEK